jgi:Mg2+-importing ATPase
MGALSSLFDFVTFAILIRMFNAGPELFRTAWFIESMATQILVIFVIRTSAHAWAARANAVLVAPSRGALAAASVIALTPIGHAFHFVAVPTSLVLTLTAIVIVYLAAAELTKNVARRWSH